MGWRTTVVFSNDMIHELGRDPAFHALELYHAILKGPARPGDRPLYNNLFSVVEQNHCDNTTLVLVEHASGRPIGSTFWKNEPIFAMREAADKLGYRLVKRAKKK